MAKQNPNKAVPETVNLGHFCLGALLGGVIGAVAAFWFAPQSGAETRQEIEERGMNCARRSGRLQPKRDAASKAKVSKSRCEQARLRQGVSKRLSIEMAVSIIIFGVGA